MPLRLHRHGLKKEGSCYFAPQEAVCLTDPVRSTIQFAKALSWRLCVAAQ
jgi:hypothetical protein